MFFFSTGTRNRTRRGPRISLIAPRSADIASRIHFNEVHDPRWFGQVLGFTVFSSECMRCQRWYPQVVLQRKLSKAWVSKKVAQSKS